MAVDPFKHAEDEFYRLKGLLASGRLTPQQFNAELKAAMVRDAQGRYWTFAGENGKWFTYQGNTWVEANPYPNLAPSSPGPSESPLPRPANLPEQVAQPASPSAPPIPTAPQQTPPVASTPPKSGRGCGGCLLWGCLGLILVILILGVGGYLAFRSGALTPANLLSTAMNIAGLGPASIEVDNFRDDAIQAEIQQVEVAKDASAASGSLQLNPYDIKVYQSQGPGRYRVEFIGGTGGVSLGGCTLTLKGGDKYQFVALPDRIAVNRVNNPSAVGTDFVIETSSLCR